MQVCGRELPILSHFFLALIRNVYVRLGFFITMNTSGDFCRTCSFQFIDKKRKRNITGEFGIIFKAVFKESLSQDDTLPRAVCDKCRYQKASNENIKCLL